MGMEGMGVEGKRGEGRGGIKGSLLLRESQLLNTENY